MKYGLSDDSVQKINGVFATFPQVQEAILFGSRAKGNYKPGSDIDLTLKGIELTPDELYKISLELDDLLLPYIFDISLYHQIKSEDLLGHIERVGQVFYKSAMSHDMR